MNSFQSLDRKRPRVLHPENAVLVPNSIAPKKSFRPEENTNPTKKNVNPAEKRMQSYPTFPPFWALILINLAFANANANANLYHTRLAPKPWINEKKLLSINLTQRTKKRKARDRYH